MRRLAVHRTAPVIVAMVEIVACADPAALAADARVTVLDGTVRTVAFVKSGPDRIEVTENGQPTTIALDEVREIAFPYGGRSAPNAETPNGGTDAEVRGSFFLFGGGRLTGLMIGQDGESVRVRCAISDELVVPLRALAGVWFEGGSATGRRMFDGLMADREAGQDVLIVSRDGQMQTIRGGILSLGPDGGTLVFDRRERPFTLDRVVGIVFATGLKRDRDWPALVELTNGDSFPARWVSGDEVAMRFDTPMGDGIAVATDQIWKMSFTSDRIVYVSDLQPVRSETQGRLHHDPPPPRMDRSVGNGPLSVAGRTYAKGIGVRARTELVYELNGPYEKLAATIGLDDSVRPRGEVRFSVVGDGRVLYESGTVAGTDGPRNIVVDVESVKQLTLVADFAEPLDVACYADWADARLIKTGSSE